MYGAVAAAARSAHDDVSGLDPGKLNATGLAGCSLQVGSIKVFIVILVG
jgi:hypothetical protein